LGRRSRKRRDDAPPGPSGREAMSRGYARGREKDEAVRAALQPLAPGERPTALKVAVALAALFAVANLVLLAAGWELDGEDQPVVGTLIFAGVMLLAAVGMWQKRYWAVLGFEVLLGVTVLGAMLALLRAGNLAAVLLCVAVIAIAGPLFWLLIRIMARIQLPARRRSEEPVKPPVS
jgi:hypothetical protein